ncbi:MAG: DUF1294 domain-containing protein [Clostridia bacterium]|nr:DUF1294 domain-containing protein [Clostridia bacterium]MBP5781764.1 DUF1294 domain-containing protein [Clostridia bacterium]
MDFSIFALIFVFLISVVTFVLYGVDKHLAVNGKRRISEMTLLVLGIVGGAPGGLLAMQHFRHKTRHKYFYVVNFIGLGLLIVFFVVLFIVSRKTGRTM